MNKKTLNKVSLIKAALAILAGYGYFYYIFIHSDIQVLNPHLVFFMLMAVMLVISLFINQVYFVGVMITGAIGFYVWKFTAISNELEYLRLTIMSF